MQWWDHSNSVSWGIEQLNVDPPLKEWCLLAVDGPKLCTEIHILGALLQTWKRCLPQLVPSVSPLASFTWHPTFQKVMKRDDFKSWKQEELDRFINLGSGNVF